MGVIKILNCIKNCNIVGQLRVGQFTTKIEIGTQKFTKYLPEP